MRLAVIALMLSCCAPQTPNQLCLDPVKAACIKARQCALFEETEETATYCEPCAGFYLNLLKNRLQVSDADVQAVIDGADCSQFAENEVLQQALACITGSR